MNEEAIFEEILSLPNEQRQSRIEELCKTEPGLRIKLEQLLAMDDLLSGDNSQSGNSTADHGKPKPPIVTHQNIGPYRLLQKLGEGGMGAVWVAEQTHPVRRRVALKLIKAGMDSSHFLSRFELERQALSMMEHPYIARIFDAGQTPEGRPYFAMELVKGEPVTKYCDEVHASIEDRLRLFTAICSAVQHAHTKGIVHRDLKPNNILVAMQDGQPVPKIIDFGVSKVLNDRGANQTLHTEIGQMLGTLEYMAPEQAELSAMDIDTRADVYALGVLLYELLVGSTPLTRERLKSAALIEVLRVIKEEEPAKPSTRLSHPEFTLSPASVAAARRLEPRKLQSILKGELDWIVLKALEKDRTRRYDSPNALKREIERYLSDEAIEARPPSQVYYFSKFYRRNRSLMLVSALAIMALGIGAVTATIAMYKAQRQEVIARNETLAKEKALLAEGEQRKIAVQEKKMALDFRDKALRALRATTNEDVEKLLGEKKELSVNEKAYLDAIARRWQGFAEQEGNNEQARALRAEGFSNIASLKLLLGNINDTLINYQQAAGIYQKLSTEFPATFEYRERLAAMQNEMGILLRKLGKISEAKKNHDASLKTAESMAQDFPNRREARETLVISYNSLANFFFTQNQNEVAEDYYRNALSMQQKLVSEYPKIQEYRFKVGLEHLNFSACLRRSNKLKESELEARESCSILEKLVAEFPDNLGYRQVWGASLNALGNVQKNLDRTFDAIESYRTSSHIQEKLATEYPSMIKFSREAGLSFNNLARLEHQTGDKKRAEKYWQKSLQFRKKVVQADPHVVEHQEALASTYAEWAELLMRSNKQVEAEEQFRNCLTCWEKLIHESPNRKEFRHQLGMTCNKLGGCLNRSKKVIETEAVYQQALKINGELVKDYPTNAEYRETLSQTYSNLGLFLKSQNKEKEAEKMLKARLEIIEALTSEFPQQVEYQIYLGGDYCNLSGLKSLYSPEQSLALLDKAVSLLQPIYLQFPRNALAKGNLRNSQWGRAVVFYNQGRFAESATAWDKVIELAEPGQQNDFRSNRALAQAKAGFTEQAITELVALTKYTQMTTTRWYYLAATHSILALKLPEQRKYHEDKAMELLRMAVNNGIKNVSQLRHDKDFDSLRDREDFKKLILDLEKQSARK